MTENNKDIMNKLGMQAYKTGKLVIRLDNIIQKRAGQKQLFRMMAISLGNYAGLNRKDVIKECKNNNDQYIELCWTGTYKELKEKLLGYQSEVLKTNFLLAIKKAFLFMNKEQKEKAAQIEDNKTWQKVEDMLLIAGIVFTATFYDRKGNEL